MAANGGHSQQYLYPSSSLHHHLITNKPTLFRATNRPPVKTAQNAKKWGVVLVEIA